MKNKLIYIFLYPLLLFISLEIMNIPSDYNIPALLISCIFLYLEVAVVYMLTGSIIISGLLTSALLLAFYIVNYYRRMLTGYVMVPADLNFIKQANMIVSYSNPPIKARVLISALCVFGIQIPLLFISKQLKFSIKRRVSGFIVTGAMMALLFFSPFSREKLLPFFNIFNTELKGINHIYETNGALMGFYTLFFANQAEEPEDYDKEHIENILYQVEENAEEDYNPVIVKPDVIVIMSESFTDPARLPNVEYSEDPAPNLHKLLGRSTSGHIITPSFGGLTCNPEYEFLTGCTMVFTGYGDTPFHNGEKYIDCLGERTLAGMFKQNGYKTVGLHTNTAAFYERDKNYPKLGFDEFIAAEDMPDAKYKGNLLGQELISDEYFMDRLLQIINNSEKPLFFFGVTMQNHKTYLPDKYESMSVKAESGLLNEEDTACLEAYLEGIKDADLQLGRLYEHVMASDRPTIVIYFGDHLPIITQNTGIFNDLGYVLGDDLNGLTTDEAYKIYTTPYVVFSNYKTLPETWGDISPYFLGALASEEAGIELNLHYKFLLQAYKRFHAMTDKLYVNEDGEVYSEPCEEDYDIIEMFKSLQYDAVFGNNYAAEAYME